MVFSDDVSKMDNLVLIGKSVQEFMMRIPAHVKKLQLFSDSNGIVRISDPTAPTGRFVVTYSQSLPAWNPISSTPVIPMYNLGSFQVDNFIPNSYYETDPHATRDVITGNYAGDGNAQSSFTLVSDESADLVLLGSNSGKLYARGEILAFDQQPLNGDDLMIVNPAGSYGMFSIPFIHS
jgi:hypothetical protein